MPNLWFAAFAGAAFLPAVLCSSSVAEDDGITPIDCLPVMNGLRADVGLPPLVSISKKKEIEGEDQLDDVPLCDVIRKGTDPGLYLRGVGLSLAASIQDNPEGDCIAAVHEWVKGIQYLGKSLPPVYTPGEPPYDRLDTVSLLNVLNTQEGASSACVVLSCPDTTVPQGSSSSSSTQKAASTASNSDKTAKATASGETSDKQTEQFNALVCLFEPSALNEGIAPFTESQWKTIKKVLKNSASAAAPSLAAVAAAVVGLLLL